MCEAIKDRVDNYSPEVNDQTPPSKEAENDLTIGKIIDTLSVGDWIKLGSLALSIVFVAYAFGKWDWERERRASAVMEEFYALYIRLLSDEEGEDKSVAVDNFVAFIERNARAQPDGSQPLIKIKVCPKSADTKIELPNKTVYSIPSVALPAFKKANLANARPAPRTKGLMPDASTWVMKGWLTGRDETLPTLVFP